MKYRCKSCNKVFEEQALFKRQPTVFPTDTEGKPYRERNGLLISYVDESAPFRIVKLCIWCRDKLEEVPD